MARNTRYQLNFSLILLFALAIECLFADESARGSDVDTAFGQWHLCNFNVNSKAYNATDLLLCMNELATSILSEQNANQNKMADRAYENRRQSYPAYPLAPDYSIPSITGDFSNYYGDDMISSLFSGGSPLPNLLNLLNFNGLTRPNFNLFGALSSITRYDDLKCVPRILCEVASGSTPGSLTYRQSSTFQDFGKNALFGLLTAFDASGTSPIITFGKAALLGYTNRGRPDMCFNEYSRCPRDPDQLISYLNNHNGGFFRLFQGNRGSHYRPPQSAYQPYYKNSVESRIVQTKTGYQFPQTYLGSESDRTGTGKLTLANSDYYSHENKNTNFFPSRERESESSKVVFPKEKRENNFQSNRIIKALNSFYDFTTNSIQKDQLLEDNTFFPKEGEKYNNDEVEVNHVNHNREPHNIEEYKEVRSENKESFIHFPHDSVITDTSTFIFWDNSRDY